MYGQNHLAKYLIIILFALLLIDLSSIQILPSSVAQVGGNQTGVTSMDATVTEAIQQLQFILDGYIFGGEWSLSVQEGNVTDFTANFIMVHPDGTEYHVHNITNFVTPSAGVQLVQGQEATISGTADIYVNGTNRWPGAAMTLALTPNTAVMTIMPAVEDTDNHFQGQPIYGIVSGLTGENGTAIVQTTPPGQQQEQEGSGTSTNVPSSFGTFTSNGVITAAIPEQGIITAIDGGGNQTAAAIDGGGNQTAGGGREFSIASALRNLPQNTSSQLLGITNQPSLISHLDILKQLIEFPSGFSKVSTYPAHNITVHYSFSPTYLSPDGEPYALLMLMFGGGNQTFTDLVDYSVKINGTNNFNFEEKGTTDTGVDIKIMRGASFTKALDSPGNYSMVINIINMDNNPVNEQTSSSSINIRR